MKYVAGIDVGSTYTKVVLLSPDNEIMGKDILPTGFKLTEVSRKVFDNVLLSSGLSEDDIGYIIATGYGRHRVNYCDLTVTDLTSTARGSNLLFPGTMTVLDIGGQTMKASRLDENVKVKSFRLNDKCAAGTGAFLEKTARYMGYDTEEIGPLVLTSKETVPISGVCAVFAESEVINQLSLGSAPSDIMYGAMSSLVKRAIQLLKRVKMEPNVTLSGGIMRFPSMIKLLEDQLEDGILNVPEGDLVQFTTAVGAATLALQRMKVIVTAGVSNVCDISPSNKDKLKSDGWEKQFTCSEPRLSEAIDLFKSLRREVHLEPLIEQDKPMGSNCDACYMSCSDEMKTIWTRKLNN